MLKKFRESEIHTILFFILVAGMFLAYLVGRMTLPSERLLDDVGGVDVTYQGSWTQVSEDGRKQPVTLPFKGDLSDGKSLILETVLPEGLEENKYFCYHTDHQNVKIYLDGQLMDEYKAQGAIFGADAASRYLFLELTGEDCGKTLRLEISGDNLVDSKVRQAYYGERYAIFWMIAFGDGFIGILGAVMSIVGLLIVLVSLLEYVIFKRPTEMNYLAWVMLVIGIWMFMESGLRQFFVYNLTFTANYAYVVMTIIPVTVALYTDYLQKKRHRRLLMPAIWLMYGDFLICCFLHIIGVCSLVSSSVFSFLVMDVAFTMIFISIGMDFHSGKIREYRPAAIGLIALGCSVILEVIHYAFPLYRHRGLIVCAGMLALFACCLYHTISEQVRFEQGKQNAEAMVRAKDRFLARMSHEIRTPINSMMGMTEMILRESNEPDTVEYALTIEQSGNVLLTMVDDVLDLAKLESHEMPIVEAEYQLIDILEDIDISIGERAKEKGLNFIINTEPDIPKVLVGDGLRIRQILLNLLTNAVKYTENGVVTLRMSSELQENETCMLTIQVMDTGIGIRPEDLDEIFADFSTIGEKLNHYQGTGLGLSITKQLLELMGGTIEVHSNFGKGSIFTVHLPQKIRNQGCIGNWQEHKSAPKAVKHESNLQAEGVKILAVDDTASNLRVLEGLLKNSGVNLTCVISADRAVKACKAKDFDLILMDHMMPEKDGVECLHELKNYWRVTGKEIPTIALTANAVVGAREYYLKEGFTDYISKPVHPAELERAIEKYGKHQ